MSKSIYVKKKQPLAHSTNVIILIDLHKGSIAPLPGSISTICPRSCTISPGQRRPTCSALRETVKYFHTDFVLGFPLTPVIYYILLSRKKCLFPTCFVAPVPSMQQ